MSINQNTSARQSNIFSLIFLEHVLLISVVKIYYSHLSLNHFDSEMRNKFSQKNIFTENMWKEGLPVLKNLIGMINAFANCVQGSSEN